MRHAASWATKVARQTSGAQTFTRRAFSMIPTHDIDQYFDQLLGAQHNLRLAQERSPFETGYRYGQGLAMRVLLPKDTQELSSILAFCHEHELAVVPQGGNTGLVGASTPDMTQTQIVLNTRRLHATVMDFDAVTSTARVGAGVILDQLNETLLPHQRWLPIDIGASGSCHVGGLIATNAAGTRAGRYGNTKACTESLEVVLADGTVQEMPVRPSSSPSGLKQDNSRIDPENPFCGSEGTLGIVTQATMKLSERPCQYAVYALVPESPEHIHAIFQHLDGHFGDKLTAFESMSDASLHAVAKHVPSTPYMFDGDSEKQAHHKYALLVEVSSTSASDSLEEALQDAVIGLFEKGLIVTGRQDRSTKSHPSELWHVRHHITEAAKLEAGPKGGVIATDIAVPDGQLSPFRETVIPEILERWPWLQPVPFGHEMMDAVHFNFVWPSNAPQPFTPKQKEEIQRYVYQRCVEFGGSFSAEHGIGPHNQAAYDAFTPQAVKDEAQRLKEQYDPKGILNPNVSFGWEMAKSQEKGR